MKKLIPLLLAALLLVASACGSDDVNAANVNGDEIPNSQVTQELEAIDGNKAYVDAIEQSSTGQDGSPIKVTGQADNSFDSAFVAQVLTRQIIFELIDQEVTSRDLEVTDAALDRSREDLQQQIPENILDDFPEEYVDLIAGWNASALVLQGDLVGLGPASEDAAKEYFEKNPDDFEQVCASHILVETKQEAEEIRTQLLAGADFATVAKERSTDTSSAQEGGELPCSFKGTFQPAFDEAAFSQKIGEIGEPVETSFGWHVIKVTERKQPKYEDVADQVDTQLQNLSSQRFGEWLQKALLDAEIRVNPKYGSWNGDEGRVEPPGKPTTTTSEGGGLPGVPLPEDTPPSSGPPPTG